VLWVTISGKRGKLRDSVYYFIHSATDYIHLRVPNSFNLLEKRRISLAFRLIYISQTVRFKMKKLMLFVFVVISFSAFQVKAAPEYGGDGYFYSALAPYGDWIELNDGMTVWHPIMMPRHWQPYTIGRWEWTADGWYWDSDEPFGYITYHYGRWYNDDYYGWIWVPDDQWAPAWVEWRYDDDYIGWAPLSPYGLFEIGFGLRFTHEYHPPYGYWNFVVYNHFCDYNVYNYYAGPTYKYRIYNGTKYRTDYDYNNGRVINRGVGYDIIRQRSGRPIKTREIIRTTDPRQVTGNRDRNVIRTYVASKQDISRDNLRDINIKRTERKTSMDVSRVNLGERNITRRNDVIRDRQTPVVDRNNDIQRRDIQEQQNRQRQQQIEQETRQRQADVQRQQQVDQQNRQRQQDLQRQQQVEQQNRQRQQQFDQQNRERQQIEQRNNQRQQQIDQQNRQRQQQTEQLNRQRQQQVEQRNNQRQEQVQQRQKVEQPPRQRQQTEQRDQRNNDRGDRKDNDRGRR
jgi:hypothetical protein